MSRSSPKTNINSYERNKPHSGEYDCQRWRRASIDTQRNCPSSNPKLASVCAITGPDQCAKK